MRMYCACILHTLRRISNMYSAHRRDTCISHVSCMYLHTLRRISDMYSAHRRDTCISHVLRMYLAYVETYLRHVFRTPARYMCDTCTIHAQYTRNTRHRHVFRTTARYMCNTQHNTYRIHANTHVLQVFRAWVCYSNLERR